MPVQIFPFGIVTHTSVSGGPPLMPSQPDLSSVFVFNSNWEHLIPNRRPPRKYISGFYELHGVRSRFRLTTSQAPDRLSASEKTWEVSWEVTLWLGPRLQSGNFRALGGELMEGVAAGAVVRYIVGGGDGWSPGYDAFSLGGRCDYLHKIDAVGCQMVVVVGFY